MFSYLQITEKVSPPRRLANHSFFTTANFNVSHVNFAFKLVCSALAIPTMISKSLCNISSHNSEMKNEHRFNGLQNTYI